MVYDLAIDNRMFLESRVDAGVQELDMLFNTVNTELLGYPQYGTDFEQYLWDMTPSPDSLKSYIQNRINTQTMIMRELEYSVDVSVISGTARQIYLVQVVIQNDDNYIVRRYELK